MVLCAALAVEARGQLNLDALQPAGQAGPRGDGPVKVTARIAPATDKGPAQLVVTADVAPGWHIYSITQKRGGPVPTKIAVEPAAGIKLAGDFTPNAKPEIHPEPAFDNLPVETHEKRVIWTAPLELAAGTDVAKLALTGKLSFQACDASSCLPPKSLPFTAALGAVGDAPPKLTQEPERLSCPAKRAFTNRATRTSYCKDRSNRKRSLPARSAADYYGQADRWLAYLCIGLCAIRRRSPSRR